MKRKWLLPLVLSVAPAFVWAHGGHAEVQNAGHAHGPEAGQNAKVGPIGAPGDPARVDRSIDVLMDDGMRFEPAHIQVRAGETIRFRVRNVGMIDHEMVLGSLADLRAHAEQMRSQPGMAHDEPNAVSLKAQAQGDLVWSFATAGDVDFACLLPGHSEAGMVGKVQVL